MFATGNEYNIICVHCVSIGAVCMVRMHHICSISHCLSQVDVFEYYGNPSAAGEKLRLDSMHVISLLRREAHTYSGSRACFGTKLHMFSILAMPLGGIF